MGYDPASVYERALRECTPESIALALVAITAGDIRGMLVRREELAACFSISPTAMSHWAHRHKLKPTHIGKRSYYSKLDVILVLHGRDIARHRDTLAAVGVPPWVAQVGAAP